MTDRPDETWDVERLGQYCSRTRKKLAIEAWRFGHALELARAKQDHGNWQNWKKEYVPGLSHGSEYRYRRLAKLLTEDSLVGLGLTEAYRLLDLPDTKGEDVDRPPAVAAEYSDLDSGPPNDSGDFTVLPEVAPFAGAEPDPSHFSIVPLADSSHDDAVPPAHVATGDLGTPDEWYRQHLAHARGHAEALRSWAGWLKQQDEAFRGAMWAKHGSEDFLRQIGQTIEGLRWLADHVTGPATAVRRKPIPRSNRKS